MVGDQVSLSLKYSDFWLVFRFSQTSVDVRVKALWRPCLSSQPATLLG